MPIQPVLKAFAKQTIPVSSTPIGFDSALLAGTVSGVAGNPAEAVEFTVETDQVRCWTSGDDPNASVGMLLDVDDCGCIEGHDDLVKARFVRVTNDAVLQVQFLREG